GLGLVSPRSQGVADHALVSTDRRLDLGPKIVATGFLPAHATAFSDFPEVEVALRRSDLGGRARNRSRTRWHNDRGIRMTLGHCLVHPVLIVGTVSRERGDGIIQLVEQRASPRGV